MRFIIFCFIAFCYICQSHATESVNANTTEVLQPAARLRKLSLSLKGVLPQPNEYRKLNELKTSEAINQFFSDKANEYSATDEFYSKIAFKAVEDLSLHAKSSLTETQEMRVQFLKTKSLGAAPVKGFNLAQLFKAGWSWDQILASDAIAEYNTAIKLAKGSTLSEKLFSEVHEKSLSPMGVLSSSFFIERFTQTQYSKAAATYRIFLCDVMTPIALGANSINKDANRTFSFSLQKADTSAANVATANMTPMHVQEACLGCHKKLDPARNILLGNVKFPIQFVYTNDEGQNKSIQVASQSDFIQQLMTQDQYYSCQIKRFWKWYIGDDVAIPPEMLKELRIQYLDSQNRKEKGNPLSKFISKLVNLKEFYTQPNFDQPTFTSVRPVLKVCDQCHSNESGLMLPDFGGKVPYRISFEKMSPDQVRAGHVSFLQDILQETHFSELGKNAEMPPPAKLPPFGLSEFVTIAKWIKAGARDDAGERTITEDDALKILKDSPEQVTAALSQKQYLPASLPLWKRYIENFDLLFLYDQLFGLNKYEGLMSPALVTTGVACNFENLKRLAQESTYSLANRKILFEKPSEFFLTATEACVPLFYNSAVKASATQPEKSFLATYLKYEFTAVPMSQFETTRWTQISDEQKNNLIRTIIRALVGPEILNSQKEAQRVATIIKTFSAEKADLAKLSLADVSKRTILYLTRKDLFLSF